MTDNGASAAAAFEKLPDDARDLPTSPNTIRVESSGIAFEGTLEDLMDMVKRDFTRGVFGVACAAVPVALVVATVAGRSCVVLNVLSAATIALGVSAALSYVAHANRVAA